MPAATPAVVHVDLDGARHIFQAHDWPYDETDDPLFESGLKGALDLFARAGVQATLFLIAEDLSSEPKRRLIERAVVAGHEIASHSFTHRRLSKLNRADKTYEIVESRAAIRAALGVPVGGFRAPGFDIDDECIELIIEAGYSYDSSVLAEPRRRIAAKRRGRPGRQVLQVPVPARAPFRLPFHPSYSLVVGDWYFRDGLEAHRGSHDPFVLLFHLTDFADPLPPRRLRGWRQRLFTLSHLSAANKRQRSEAMLALVAQHYMLTTTSSVLPGPEELTADGSGIGVS